MAWIMAAAMCLTATACGSTASSTASTAGSTAASTVESSSVEGAFNLGLICPLSGSSAVSGQIMQNATKMAVDEINAAGGINGTIPINLVAVDDEGVPATSVTAMQKLVEQDKVNAVIGAQDLIVNVHTHHGIGAQLGRPLLHFVQGLLAGVDELLLVGAGAAAEEVAEPGHKVLDEVHTGNDLTENNALIFRDTAALHRGGSGYDHVFSSLLFILRGIRGAAVQQRLALGVHQDGLVHVTQLPWRVKHPSDRLAVGDVVTVWVLSVDEGKKRISLTMKRPQ